MNIVDSSFFFVGLAALIGLVLSPIALRAIDAEIGKTTALSSNAAEIKALVTAVSFKKVRLHKRVFGRSHEPPVWPESLIQVSRYSVSEAWLPEITLRFQLNGELRTETYIPKRPSLDAYELVALSGNEQHPTQRFSALWNERLMSKEIDCLINSTALSQIHVKVVETDLPQVRRLIKIVLYGCLAALILSGVFLLNSIGARLSNRKISQ